MNGEDRREKVIRLTLPKTTAADLRGRQSVRATFKLSERAIHALSIVSLHLGIKQKSLFDHLVEDDETLALIARQVGREKFERENAVQKTYVLSRQTLSCLERAARHFNTPRDALVEYSIQRLLPLIARERERHRRRKQLLGEIDDYLRAGRRLAVRCGEQLDPEDPVVERLSAAVAGLEAARDAIALYVEKGAAIESF